MLAQPTICSIADCNKIVRWGGGANGWCEMHQARWRRHGDPLIRKTPLVIPPREYILTHYEVMTNGCWVWTGPLRTNGYGWFTYQQVPLSAHREAFALWTGSRPDGLEILHRCDNPPCISPDHLVSGTHRDNMRDAFDKGRMPLPGTAMRLTRKP